MCLLVVITKVWKKWFFFILKFTEERSRIRELDPDPLVGDTNQGIQIRTKMSRIPNTGADSYLKVLSSEMDLAEIRLIR